MPISVQGETLSHKKLVPHPIFLCTTHKNFLFFHRGPFKGSFDHIKHYFMLMLKQKIIIFMMSLGEFSRTILNTRHFEIKQNYGEL